MQDFWRTFNCGQLSLGTTRKPVFHPIIYDWCNWNQSPPVHPFPCKPLPRDALDQFVVVYHHCNMSRGPSVTPRDHDVTSRFCARGTPIYSLGSKFLPFRALGPFLRPQSKGQRNYLHNWNQHANFHPPPRTADPNTSPPPTYSWNWSLTWAPSKLFFFPASFSPSFYEPPTCLAATHFHFSLDSALMLHYSFPFSLAKSHNRCCPVIFLQSRHYPYELFPPRDFPIPHCS